MSQQMKGNSHHDGSRTVTERDTYRYAVVNPPLSGKWMKPQDPASLKKRHEHWQRRRAEAGVGNGRWTR